MNKLIIVLVALMTPACHVHVYEHGYVEYGETVHHRTTVHRVVAAPPRVVHRHYSWKARGCVNLNPQVCRRRGW